MLMEQPATTIGVYMRPEVELLLACARTAIDDDGARRVAQLLRENLDWACLVDLAIYHRVAPLLYRNLRARFARDVPAAAMERLRENYRAGARHMLLLAGELLKLLRLLEMHGIAALPLKGPALAARAYGDVGLRQSGDLDILVRERDVRRAQELLVARGYLPEWAAGSRQEAEFLRSGNAHTFTRADGQVIVELHCRIRHRHYAFDLDHEQLWRNTEPIELAGTQVAFLSTEDLLLTLCVHGATHLWQGLFWVCDIAEILRSTPAIDWETLLAQARALSCERIVLTGLLLAGELLGAPLPRPLLLRARADNAVSRVARQSYDILFNRAGGQLHRFEEIVFYLRSRERSRDRARFLLAVVATPFEDDFALLPLPRALAFLYGPLRVLRLAGKYGRVAAGGALGQLRKIGH